MRKAIIACLAFAFSLAVYALPAVAEDQKKDPPKQPACTSNVCQKYKEDKKGIVQNITGKTTMTKAHHDQTIVGRIIAAERAKINGQAIADFKAQWQTQFTIE